MTQSPHGHVFISYVREDGERVDRLERLLESFQIAVWRDVRDLSPGVDWKLRIREAIEGDALAFLACFSAHSVARTKSGQNEELMLAVDQLRLRPVDLPWLIPVRLDDVTIPSIEIGGGRMLGGLQRVDLFGDEAVPESGKLVSAVLNILGRKPPESEPLPELVDTKARLQTLLREDNGDIATYELVAGVADDAYDAITNQTRFPNSSDELRHGTDEAILHLAQVAEDYLAVIQPLLEVLAVCGAWGRQTHERTWKRAMERIAQSNTTHTGQVALLELRWVPLVAAAYTIGVAGVWNENYGPVRAALVDAEVRDLRAGRIPICYRTDPWRPFRELPEVAQVLAYRAEGATMGLHEVAQLRSRQMSARYTPASNYLHAVLRPIFADMIPDDQDYTDAFNRFELLLAAIMTDARTDPNRSPEAWPDHHNFGRVLWDNHVRYERNNTSLPEVRLLTEATSSGSNWPPLQARLFNGEFARATAALELVVSEISECRARLD